MEFNRLLEIAADRETCDFCVDCGNDAACIKCDKVKGIKADELREYHAAVRNALRRTFEYDKAREEGRLVMLPCNTGRTVYIVDGREINRCIVGNALVRNGLLTRKIDTDTHYAVYPEDIGKTVFLTRGEAEAALGGGWGG